MDAFVDIVSVRAVREYSDQPLPDDVAERILQAGRVTGSSRNSQPWTFHIARRAETLALLSQAVFAPENVRDCRLAVAIVSAKGGFDIGRCAQNMMLAAWNDGVGSTPNGIKDPNRMNQMLRLPEGHSAVTVLSFGYPARAGKLPDDTSAILARVKRTPLEELVVNHD